MKASIKDPTTRKVRNRGFVPCRYRTGGDHSEVRNGWIIERTSSEALIRLVGEERNRRIRGIDLRHLVELD